MICKENCNGNCSRIKFYVLSSWLHRAGYGICSGVPFLSFMSYLQIKTQKNIHGVVCNSFCKLFYIYIYIYTIYIYNIYIYIIYIQSIYIQYIYIYTIYIYICIYIVKKRNRLLNKRMSNIYSKVTIEMFSKL